LAIISSSGQLSQQIDENEKWKWANNDENAGMLNRAREKLKTELSVFGRSFLVEDLSYIKKTYSTEHLVVECEKFMLVKSHADYLSKTVRNLLNMQKGRA
jgi:hypothetical protein